MDLCMAHRFDDLHDCKPILKTEDVLEKIKASNRTFNWGFFSSGSNKKSNGDVRVAKREG